MKAIATIAVLLFAVFIVFGTLGAPSFKSSGDEVSFWTNGATIFDYWSESAVQATARERIEAEARTAQIAIVQENETQRHLIFWQYAPLVVVALALLAVGVGMMIRLWKSNAPLMVVTVNQLAAPPDLRRFANKIGVDNAVYEWNGKFWLVVDEHTKEAYQPPPHLARLPGPSRS